LPKPAPKANGRKQATNQPSAKSLEADFKPEHRTAHRQYPVNATDLEVLAFWHASREYPPAV